MTPQLDVREPLELPKDSSETVFATVATLLTLFATRANDSCTKLICSTFGEPASRVVVKSRGNQSEVYASPGIGSEVGN